MPDDDRARPAPPRREPRFSDEETRQILARAAARQEAAARLPGAEAAGTSIEALREIAREVGLDPAHVDAAARDLVLRREAPPVQRTLGLPTTLREQRVIAAGVSDAEWERMVVDFRETFGRTGIASQFGAVREWVSDNAPDRTPVTVRVEPAEGGTLVTIHQSVAAVIKLPAVVGGTFGAMGILLGALVAAGDFEPGIVLLPILLLLFAVLGGVGVWGGYRAWVPRQEERLRAVLDRAELIARTE